jgi:TonB family protein
MPDIAHRTNQIARRLSLHSLLSLLLVLLAVTNVHAQQPQIDALATRMSQALAKSKQKTVIVFDFAGPKQTVTALGQKLTDDLSAALAKSGKPFDLIDRSRLHDALQQNQHASEVITFKETAWWIAETLKANAFIWGDLEVRGDNVLVGVHAYRVKDEKEITGLKISIPLTPEMKELAGKFVKDHDAAAYPEAGAKGYSFAVCAYCPVANFSDEAVKNKVSGTIMLQAVIGVDGIPRDIKVLKALPLGLTKQAIEAVESWRLKPAKDPNGNPVAVRQTIEVTFHLY